MSNYPRIFLACVAGIGLVASAFFFAPSHTLTADSDSGLTVLGDAPSRTHIAVSDSDQDGIPDWKEKYDTSAYLDAAEESTYEEPDTFTGQFAIDYLEDIMRSNMYGAFGDSSEEILQKAQARFTQVATDPLFTKADLTLSNTTKKQDLVAYGNQIAIITQRNGVPADTRHELEIAQAAMDADDPDILQELDPIIASYQGMLSDMLATVVPTAYAKEHLDLVNTYNAILIDIQGMRNAFEDPLYALVRNRRYQEDVDGLYLAIINVYTKLYEEGARFTVTDAASSFVTFTP